MEKNKKQDVFNFLGDDDLTYQPLNKNSSKQFNLDSVDDLENDNGEDDMLYSDYVKQKQAKEYKAKNTEYSSLKGSSTKDAKKDLTDSKTIIRKALKKKQDEKMSNREFGKVSVLDDKYIDKETIESRVFDMLVEEVYYDPSTKRVYVLRNDGTQTYRKLTDEALKSRIETIIREDLMAFKYDKESTYESCIKTFFTKILSFTARHMEMKTGLFAIKIRGTDKSVFIRVKLGHDGKAKAKVIKPDASKKCFILLGGTGIPLERFTVNGQVWDGVSFDRDIDFNPVMNPEGLFTKYIYSSFTQKVFADMAARFYGAALAGLRVSTAPVFRSNGGTGKTVLMAVMDIALGHISVDYNPSDTGQFAEQALPGNVIANVDEVEKTIKESVTKKIIGNSKMTINIKFRHPIESYPMERISMFFFVNEMFKFKDQHESMERRFLFIPMDGKVSKEDRIEGLEDKIFLGSGLDEDGDKVYEKNGKGQVVHYEEDSESVIAWVVNGALEAVEKGGVPSCVDIDVPEIKDYCDKMLMKVNNTREFFEEFNVRASKTKSTGITKSDLFRLYKEYMSMNGQMAKAKGNFFQDFETKFLAVFGIDISKETRVGVTRGRGYPVLIDLPEGEYDHLKLEYNSQVLSADEQDQYEKQIKEEVERREENNFLANMQKRY